MGRKKKKTSRPWCWYCNREFDDEKILVQHQKAKHFKCHICHKKLYTGPGLSIHCMQVHKETIDKVPNALPNRSNIDIEIFGMDGIPANDLKDHERQKNGGKSESDEDEPAAKKKVEVPLAPPPHGMMIPGMMPPPMMGQFAAMTPFGHMAHMPPYMTPGGIPMLPPHLMPRPLFPAAMAANQMKPTFPAYSNATISAPPTTNNTNPSSTASSSSTNTPTTSTSTQSTTDSSKSNCITPSGTTSKICHPQEDLSLEEIRARHPRYQKLLMASASKAATSMASQNHHHQMVSTSTASSIAAAQAVAISQAQEQVAAMAAAQANANAQLQAAVHQKHLEDINRVMIQRFARQQTGPPIGMVPVASGSMNLVQPLMRGPAMALTPQGALIGSNMMRPGPPGMGGMPTGLITGMVAAPGMGVMIPGLPGGHMLQMMPPRFR